MTPMKHISKPNNFSLENSSTPEIYEKNRVNTPDKFDIIVLLPIDVYNNE